MPKFALTFEDARQPSSPEAGKQHMTDYKNWLAGLGDRLVMPQLAFRQTRVVSDQGVRDAEEGWIMGFLMIKAENMEAALAVAQQCPFLDVGTMGVAETMKFPSMSVRPPHCILHQRFENVLSV